MGIILLRGQSTLQTQTQLAYPRSNKRGSGQMAQSTEIRPKRRERRPRSPDGWWFNKTMNKPMTHLSQEVIDLSWEISQASNRAFDTLREAEASITEVQGVAKAVEGGELTYEAIAPLEKIRNDAQANFHLLTEMATPVMSLPRSPFAPDSGEAATILATQSVARATERPEVLPIDFRERLVTRYVQKREAVARQLADGALPENYQFPELSDLLERAVSLAATYEVMVESGWEPDVVFVPRGLDLEQWNALLTGHRLVDQSWSEGLHRTWAGFEIAHPASSEVEVSPWSIAVISGAERPVLTSVSKDGKHGFNAKKAVKELSELPSVTDTSSAEAVILQASPTEERYLALQLAHLERGERPVDSKTWTIGRENLEIGEEWGSLYFYFHPKECQFKSIWRRIDVCDNSDGIRPSAGDEDVVANS